MLEGQDIQSKIRDHYLAYRLNNRELVHLVRGLQEGAPVEAKLDLYSRESHDEKGEVAAQELQGALEQVGLAQQFAELKSDAVWSAYDRALYRRLSHPDFDPQPYQNNPDGPGSVAFCEVMRAKFEDWDRNHDTRLGTQELDRAMAESHVDPLEDAALVLLRSRLSVLGSCNPVDGDGVSTSDLAIFATQGIPNAGIVTEGINKSFDELVEKAQAAHSTEPLLQEDFDPRHVNQNKLGSCVLLATAGSLEPQEMRSLFSQDADGNAVVTFKNGETEVVTDPTSAERLYHAFTNDGGRWPAMMEIAVGQYLARKLRPEDGSIRTASDGIPAEEAFALLTGQDTRKISLDELAPAQARQELEALQSQEGPKICGSRPELPAGFEQRELEFLHNGIENGHAYTLLKYDGASDQVTLRNPWNRKHWVHAQQPGEPGGVFQMPFEQFYASFRWVTSGVPTPPAG